MPWWWWIPAAVAAGFALDRLALWTEARGWIYWRRRPRGARAVGGGMFGELMDAFQPSRRIVAEQRQFDQVRVNRAESGDGEGDTAG